jgi:hypothetical protein
MLRSPSIDYEMVGEAVFGPQHIQSLPASMAQRGGIGTVRRS